MRLLGRYLGVSELWYGYRKCCVHNPPWDYLKVPTKEWNWVSQLQIDWRVGAHYKEDKVTASVYVSLEVGEVSSWSLPMSRAPMNSKYK